MSATGYGEGIAFFAALGQLDALLARSISRAAQVYGSEAAADPYRGLVIGPDEVMRLLGRSPGAPTFAEGDASMWTLDCREGALAWLQQAFALTPFDVSVLVIALAPEVDLRYERLYGYLHDDVTRRRPSIDLALNLLCTSPAHRVEARSRFAPDAPLVRNRLIRLVTDGTDPDRSLLTQSIRPDPHVVRLVLGERSLDPRLADCADVVPLYPPAGSVPFASVDFDISNERVIPRGEDQPPAMPLRLYFEGRPDAGQLQIATALAADRGTRLLVVDLVRAMRSKTPVDEVIGAAFRHAWFLGTALMVTAVDALLPDGRAVDALLREVSGTHVTTILAGQGPWPPTEVHSAHPTGVVVTHFREPTSKVRRKCWQVALSRAEIGVNEADLDSLADRYRLTPTGIAEAVQSVHHRGLWNQTAALPSDLFAAAREQSGHELGTVARKIERTYAWDDLVLPDAPRLQLQELRDRVAQRRRVLEEWRFERSLPIGRGICALFAGPSGTGKTMAADVVASELDLDLYKIDLATVVSKYIGETEKNLERIFRAAETANAVLFFDEADAIFGKRSQVRDAHDRYANIEIAYLLQRMEQYDGIAVLATNAREQLDDAFLRRLHFIIDFAMPDERQRERMWREFIPSEAPVGEAVDFTFLAEHFHLSGGSIRNVVVSAAYLASSNGGRIEMEHLIQATWREHQKIGRLLSMSDLGDYALSVPDAGHDLVQRAAV